MRHPQLFLRRTAFLFLLVFASFPLAVAQPDNEAAGSSDVATQLDALGYNYEFTEAGNIKCVFEVGESGRTQLVIVKTITYQYGDLDIREVISLAGRFKKVKPTVMLQLLEDSGRKKLGAWSVEKDDDDGQYYVFFTARIPATSTAEEVNSTLQLVAEAADEMEQLIVEGDEF